MQDDDQINEQRRNTELVYGKSTQWLIGWLLTGIILLIPLWLTRDSYAILFWIPAFITGLIIVIRTILSYLGNKIILEDRAIIFTGGALFKSTEDVPYSHISGIDVDDFWGTISISMTDGGRETYSGIKDFHVLKDELKERISEKSYNTNIVQASTSLGYSSGLDLNYLERLQALRQQGALTESEFEAEKQKFLNR